jgi:ATP-binding cassette subfamily B protein
VSAQDPIAIAHEFGARQRVTLAALAYAAGLLWTHARLPASLLLARGVLAGTVAPLVVWAMTGLIDALSQAPANPWPAVAPWLAALLVATGIRSATSAAAMYLATLTREQLLTAMHREVFEHAVALPLTTFEYPDYYQKLDTGRWALNDDVVEILGEGSALVSSIIAGLGLLLLFAEAHWLLAVVLVGTAVLRAVVGTRLVRRQDQVTYASSPLKRELGYWAGLLSSRDAAPELRLRWLPRCRRGWTRCWARSSMRGRSCRPGSGRSWRLPVPTCGRRSS